MITPEQFGSTGIDGDVTLTSIIYDWNSEIDYNKEQTETYLACGYFKSGAENAGLVVHGTADGEEHIKLFKRPHVIMAPVDENKRPIATEFYGIETAPNVAVKLTGCYVLGGEERSRRGFFYEGPLDGSGDWYPIDAPGCDETVAIASKDYIVICCDPSGKSGDLHVLSLKSLIWSSFPINSTGMAKIEIVSNEDERFVIVGSCDGGGQFSVEYDKSND